MMRRLWPALLVCMALSTAAVAGTAFWAPLSGNTAGHARINGTGIDTAVSIDPTLVNRPFNATYAPTNPTSGIADAGNGRYNVVGNIGRHKGTLTNDAGDWLKIDDTQAYTFYASWDLPPSPLSDSNPAPGTGTITQLNARMYAGPNTGWTWFTTGAGLQLDAGVEWDTGLSKWVIDSDTSANLGARTPIDATFTHFEIFYTYTPGTYTVEYAIDYGPRVAMFGSPLALDPAGPYAAYLTPLDAIQTSYRGDAARNFYAYATGGGVAVVGNGGAGDDDGDGVIDLNDKFPTNPALSGDTDGDGVDDQVDPWPTDPDYSVDTDDDSLPDEWEEAYWPGDLSQGAGDDPDNDGYTNAQEFANGFDPLVYEGPVPVAGLAGLLGLGLGLAAVGARIMRKR